MSRSRISGFHDLIFSASVIETTSAAVGPIAFFLGYSYDKQEKVLEQLLKELEKSERPPSDDSL